MDDILHAAHSADERLLRTLAEQLKSPLYQIARHIELHQLTDEKLDISFIEHTANATMRLIDSYILSVGLQGSSEQLEPVSVSAVLHDAAHATYQLAKQYNCTIATDIGGPVRPVMAQKTRMRAAFESLLHASIMAAPAENKSHIVLGAKLQQQGVLAGVYGSHFEISPDALKRGRALFGSATNVLPSIALEAGAGVFIADALFTHIAEPLKPSRHHHLPGLAAQFLPSQQLALG